MKIQIEIKEEIINAAKAVEELYAHQDAGLGGYGHVVFEDDNLDMVDSCLRSCDDAEFSDRFPEEVRLLSIKALLAFKLLDDEDDMMIALFIQRGTIKVCE